MDKIWVLVILIVALGTILGVTNFPIHKEFINLNHFPEDLRTK